MASTKKYGLAVGPSFGTREGQMKGPRAALHATTNSVNAGERRG
jgi:hypothetical protein